MEKFSDSKGRQQKHLRIRIFSRIFIPDVYWKTIEQQNHRCLT